MDGVLFSPTPDSILRDARLLNSDIGRHSVKSNFSTRLSGRFYQNGSLERHTFRTSRLVEMQAKKRRLEKELQLEERRVKLLEERLGDTEKAREDSHGLIITIERGLIQLQTFVRRRQALRLFRTMRHKSLMMKLVARFFQRHYRGWKGRLCADSRREYLRQERRDESAAYIQANVRRRIQRRRYLDLLSERERLSNISAAAIQAKLRGKVARLKYLAEMSRRQIAARTAQRMWRGAVGRRMSEERRQDLVRNQVEAEKPKRIPLHLRRYSTYGSGSNNKSQRKANNATKKRDVRMRRRSSDAMIIMNDGQLSSLRNFRSTASTGHEPDENDSIASTMTSLTNQTNATGNSSKRRMQHHHRTNPPPWPAPQRVLASERPNRRATTLQPCNKVNSRRASIERRKTITGGSIGLLHPRKLSSRERIKPSLQTVLCNDSEESNQESTSTAPREIRQNSSTTPKRRDHNDDYSDANGVLVNPNMPSREGISTPIVVSEEASLIVQEVLGKTILCHSILHSGFDDECSEHEDDLI